AHHVAAEHVEHDVEVEVAPLHRSLELRDVPAPELVRCGRKQLGGSVERVLALRAALTYLAPGGEDAVHRALAREIAALVQERGVDLCRSEIDETWLVQHVEHPLAFGRREGTW